MSIRSFLTTNRSFGGLELLIIFLVLYFFYCFNTIYCFLHYIFKGFIEALDLFLGGVFMIINGSSL
jgi:hypothetical protein